MEKILPHFTGIIEKSSKEEALNTLLEELNKGLKKGKWFSSATIFNRNLCLNGTKSRKRLMRLVTEHFGGEVEHVEAKRANEPYLLIPKITKAETVQCLAEIASSEKYTPIYTGASQNYQKSIKFVQT